MRRVPFAPLSVLLLSGLCPSTTLRAQAGGVRGAASEPPILTRLPAPDAATAERLITIEGVAAVRVVPTSLRLVFAVSATGADGGAASTATRKVTTDTQQRLIQDSVPAAAIDVDFIAAMPVYEWRLETQDGKNAVVERQVGVRVQYNLHVRVADEAAAQRAIETATATNGVTLLAVDYWSEVLDQQRIEVQKLALAAAQEKATRLLAVFREPPRPVNVHESTQTIFPHQLYRSLPAAEDRASTWYSRDEVPRLPASRPLQVYYRGLFADLDDGTPAMPGVRHIEVVSTVRLYFEAPHRSSAARER